MLGHPSSDVGGAAPPSVPPPRAPIAAQGPNQPTPTQLGLAELRGWGGQGSAPAAAATAKHSNYQ